MGTGQWELGKWEWSIDDVYPRASPDRGHSGAGRMGLCLGRFAGADVRALQGLSRLGASHAAPLGHGLWDGRRPRRAGGTVERFVGDPHPRLCRAAGPRACAERLLRRRADAPRIPSPRLSRRLLLAPLCPREMATANTIRAGTAAAGR